MNFWKEYRFRNSLIFYSKILSTNFKNTEWKISSARSEQHSLETYDIVKINISMSLLIILLTIKTYTFWLVRQISSVELILEQIMWPLPWMRHPHPLILLRSGELTAWPKVDLLLEASPLGLDLDSHKATNIKQPREHP